MKKKLTQNVNKDKLFNDLPKVKPLFSKWLARHTNYQASNIGQIIPIYYDEVLPNEKRKVTMAMTSHTTTPVAPIFNSIYTEIRAFFVPYRLCADLLNGYKTRKSPFVKVFGEDPASTSSQIIVPLAQQKLPEFTKDHQFIKDVVSYSSGASSINNVFDSLDLREENDTDTFYAKENFLNLAAYELIYQRYYRNENYEASTASPLYRLLYDAYNENKSSVSLGSSFTFEIANREKDYFTGMKPFTQKGDPVKVGLVGTAPVIGVNLADSDDKLKLHSQEGWSYDGAVQAFAFGIGSTDPANQGAFNAETNLKNVKSSDTYSSSVNVKATETTSVLRKYVADLGSVNGISIEELRLLIKTQELLEKDALYGSLYAESLNAHFGTCPLDLTLQDPQELYRTTISAHMQAIFQTSSTSGEASILGTIGANSTTQTDPFVILPEHKFEEHGILMICAVHKLQNVYDSLFFKPKMNFKGSRFDFYTPELNDLGYQPVEGGKEMMKASGTAGFNEAFAEYRYKFNKVHGLLADQFPYWAPAIADEYATASALYKESPGILDKALSVVSSTAPQFYDAWGFEEENTKPMSLHSIPGMDGVI